MILGSGSGSNAAAIIGHFAEDPGVEVVGVISDRKDAGILARATEVGIPARFIGKARRLRAGGLTELIDGFAPDLIVLAGYLRLVPEDTIAGYDKRIINIHPALLPKFGGAGMYGEHVHRAVYEANEQRSGITIHIVNANFDEGRHLFQAAVRLRDQDEPPDIARRVLALEHQHYPLVIARYLRVLRPVKPAVPSSH